MDRYYSPAWLAEALCSHFSISNGARIFDPTMGAGALLNAAVEQSRAGQLAVMGCDIDKRAVSQVRTVRPDWEVDRADIFSEGSRRQSRVWRAAKRTGVDAVMMNPPFSFRGGHRKVVSFLGENFSLTPAVAALAIVLNEVKASQGVGAILPAGSLRTETNAVFWEALERVYELKVSQELPRGSFPDAKASSLLLTVKERRKAASRLKGLRHAEPSGHGHYRSQACACVEVIRGRVQTSKKIEPGRDSVPFIHTTSLRNGVAHQGEIRRPALLATEGPMILLPRVGRFSYEKIVIVDARPFVLSDCVIALRTADSHSLETLHSALLDPAFGLEDEYGGTGAPYITMKLLISKLAKAGFAPRHVPASGTTFSCTCPSFFKIQSAS